MRARVAGLIVVALGLAIVVASLAAAGQSTITSPSVRVVPVSIQPVNPTDPQCFATFGAPCGSGFYHAVGGSLSSAPATVMIVVYLGPYAEDLNMMTGGPPGYCNGGSCDTAVFNAPGNYGPLTISWGDGTTSQVQNYWRFPNNLNLMSAYSCPGDGIGEGWAYAPCISFYHTYAGPGTYTVAAIPLANGPIQGTSVTIGSSTTTTMSTSTTTTTSTSTTYEATTQTAVVGGTTTTLVTPPSPADQASVDYGLAAIGSVVTVAGALVSVRGRWI
ncbi:MAG: hypothetical protein KGO96_13125 [Elusimicrobia bacterium]|nr:hypothetical protein [Elusimicrobiota bacterium]MDE2426836.1 hypothetical protein [Elusimicrobiota bacterium]